MSQRGIHAFEIVPDDDYLQTRHWNGRWKDTSRRQDKARSEEVGSWLIRTKVAFEGHVDGVI